MAGNLDYKKIIEDHAISVIGSNTSYQTDHFYGTFSPEELLGFIKGKLNTAKGTVFLRVSDTDWTQVDTQGLAYNASFTFQMIAGFKPVRSKQLPDSDRETDEMMKVLRPLLLTNPVTLDNDTYRFQLERDDSLIYTPDIDAQLIEYNLGSVYIEFN